MLSKLISGGTLKERQKTVTDLTEKNIYNLEIGQEEASVAIEQIRELQKNLSLAVTDNQIRTCIIWELQNLSLPAQQALLKLIEEPPALTQIILTADNAALLPETILSRCVVTYLTPPVFAPTKIEQAEIKEMLQVLSGQSYAQGLKLSEKLAKTENPAETLTKLLLIVRSGLLNQPSLKRAQVIRLLQQGIRDLSTNMNTQLVIEHCFLSIRRLND